MSDMFLLPLWNEIHRLESAQRERTLARQRLFGRVRSPRTDRKRSP